MTHTEHPQKSATTRSIPYLHKPAISPDGQYIAFVYAADIWQVTSNGGTAERLTVHAAGNFNPRYSPDGTRLAFSSYRSGNGDIYVLPMQGGEIRRLTYHDSYCGVEDWSPDGQHIYFTSMRERMGGSAIYSISLNGGTPHLINVEPFNHLQYLSVSPDGQTLAFTITHDAWWRMGPDPYAPSTIWLLQLSFDKPVEPGEPLPLEALSPFPPYTCAAATPFAYGRWPLWAPDGKGIYFVSDQDGQENIWYQPLMEREAEPRQITYFPGGRVLWPAIARHTQKMVFEHDWKIWQLDLTSEETVPVDIHMRADAKITTLRTEAWIRNYNEFILAPDGKKFAFVAHGQIFADFADKETDKELRRGPGFRITNTQARERHVTWSPDSRSLFYVSDRHGEDEIFRYDFPTRTETRLTHDAISKLLPCCSPDGKWLAYISGFECVELLNLQTMEKRSFAQGNFVRSHGLAWSPDSRWLAYISHDERFFSNAYVQHIEETEAHQVTFLSNIIGYGLLWSSDGRYLIFTSGQYRMESQIIRVDLRPPTPFLRETEFEKLFKDEKDEKARSEEPATPETEKADKEEKPDQEEEGKQTTTSDAMPAQDTTSATEQASAQTQQETAGQENGEQKVEPITITFEGIERRLSFLTPVQMDAEACAISHNSRDLLFLANVAGKVNIWTLALDEPRQDQPLQQVTANGARKSWVQFLPNDKNFCYLEDGNITVRKFPTGRDPVIVHTRGEVTVDFEHEKFQVFHEAWRWLRDNFYDPTFRGQDWNATRDRFVPLVAGAQTHGELATILNLMVGELRTSHLGASWYGGRGGSDGYTGLLFDPIEHKEHGVLRIASIVPDSPAALVEESPRIGEYLVAVDDTPITPQICLDELLHRTVGRRVVLKLADAPDSTPGRQVAIRPVDSETYEDLCYRSWVATNKAYVHRISNGRLGYVHVEDMSFNAYQEFLVNLDAETYRKEGLILDIRYNKGGHIATFILDVLTRRSVVLSGFRGRLSTDAYHHSGNRALNKPTVLVTNESSASNAEIFAEIYHRLGLGKIVGKPTAGAVIGTIDRTLLNGMRFRLPTYSISTLEGENLEGTGRKVDVEVNQPPGAWARGRDYQLDAAVETLLGKSG
jgi:Tol biopolymer transport system component/C-terminal processing protease CtpA/Prc